MTRQMTPELAQYVYMMLSATNVTEFQTSPEKAKYYWNRIECLAKKHKNWQRMNALVNKLGESSSICLFVMPEKPRTVPARMFCQYNAGFGQYINLVADEFEITRVIFRNGTKYSVRQEDDNGLTTFLKRKTQKI